MPLQPGDNPRDVLSNHNERGPKRFTLEFTYEDLADLLGMTEGALRTAVHRGRFDPGDLSSLLEYVSERHTLMERDKRTVKLRDLVAEARSLIGE